ncbi:glycosyltransferase family 4 protein [Desulfothermus naphthae]
MYISNSSHIGGGNRSLVQMAQKVKRNGHEILVVVPGKGKFLELIKKECLNYIILDHQLSNKYSKIDFICKFFKYLRLLYFYSPDIIHVNDLFCYRIVSIAAKILKIPLICHIRYSVDENSVSYYMKVLPHVIIFNSFYMKEMFIKKNPNIPETIKKEVVYNFFNPDDYYCPEMRRVIRNQWGTHNCFLVGIIGNISPQKGHDTFLRVAKELLYTSPNFRFVIVGEDLGPNKCNEKKVKRLITELNIDDYIICLGFKDNIGEVLAALDVLIVPSVYEPFGRVAVEGLLAGLPVVASKTGGLIEILKDAPYGFLVEPNNFQQFATKILEIYEKAEKIPVVLNREYAINKFSEDVNYKKLISVYFNVIK